MKELSIVPLIPPGPLMSYGAARFVRCLRAFNGAQRATGVNDAKEVGEWRRHFRMPELFKVPRGVARYVTDLMFSRASSEAGGS
jgi:hypothetical protein